jgi:hypothetical protein
VIATAATKDVDKDKNEVEDKGKDDATPTNARKGVQYYWS